jgi:hypothetical protein
MKFICIYILIFFLSGYFFLQTTKTVDDLLAHPLDVQKFKKIKGQSNCSRSKEENYYYKPPEKGMFMRFFLFRPVSGYIGEVPNNDVQIENGLSIITYKPYGKYEWKYFDPNETLIEVIAHYNDNDLPDLAFIGVDTIKIKKKLGDNFFRKDNCFIYTKDKNALILKISGQRVEWLKYTRLNTALTMNTIPAKLLQD